MMTSIGVVRSVKDRRFYSNINILFFVVLLILKLVVHSSAQQTYEVADENETPLDVGLGHGTQYGVIDNIEVHEVHIIDGVMHEGHPIIMYKEDFVNEDFDPNRHKTFKKKKNIARYPHQNTIDPYNAMKPEKIYFDILPQKPILINDDENASDDKYVAELVPLVKENANLVSKKDIHRNGIKQFPRRRKRDIVDSRAKEYQLENQNPFYYMNNKATYHTILPQFYQISQPNFVRHHVQGKPPPPIHPHKIASRGNLVDKIWDQKSKLRGQKKPFPGNHLFVANRMSDTSSSSLWHDSNPENFDFSQYDNSKPNPVTDRPLGTSRRPNNAMEPFPATTSSPQAPTRKVSNCVWAIVNCCTDYDSKVNYNCFAEFNCHGAFWDINPCSDKVRDNAISYVDSVYA